MGEVPFVVQTRCHCHHPKCHRMKCETHKTRSNEVETRENCETNRNVQWGVRKESISKAIDHTNTVVMLCIHCYSQSEALYIHKHFFYRASFYCLLFLSWYLPLSETIQTNRLISFHNTAIFRNFPVFAAIFRQFSLFF